MKDRLIRYFNATIGILPYHLVSMDSNRLTILHLALNGLAILKAIETIPDSQHLIDFILAHQIHPSEGYGTTRCGFRGSTFIGAPLNLDEKPSSPVSPLLYDSCHITMNFCALSSLLILGDDLSRVDRDAVMSGVLATQSAEHLVNASLLCSEFDMRFVFSAVLTAYVLDQMYRLDLGAFVKFIGSSITYEGGFAQLPGLEAHSGATYCALASLKLMNRLDSLLPATSRQRSKLVHWLLHRQRCGFNSRCGKDDDTCHTFWVGASLKILNVEHHVCREKVLEFVSNAWDPVVGGFVRSPEEDYVDPLHSSLSLAGLSCLMKRNSLSPHKAPLFLASNASTFEIREFSDPFESLVQLVFGSVNQATDCSIDNVVPQLLLPETAFKRLKRLHKRWRSRSKTVV